MLLRYLSSLVSCLYLVSAPTSHLLLIRRSPLKAPTEQPQFFFWSNMTSKPFPGLSLEGTVTIAPENVTKFFEILRPVYENVISEPECTFFEVFIDPDQPGVIHWVEGWAKDKAWLLSTQLQKDYYKPYLAATEPMFIKDRKFLNISFPDCENMELKTW